MSPHSCFDHDAVTMGSLIIVLLAVAGYCSEIQGNTTPITVAKPEDTKLVERNNIHTIEKGIFWKNLDMSKRKSMHNDESKVLNNETNRRKSRLLSSLAFLAGLSFGGLATAASSTAKTIAKLPQTSFGLNLGSSKGSPYLAAYYNPYPMLSYPFLLPGSIGFAPMINLAKPQTTSHNDLSPQVISLFENRPPIDLAEDNEEYLDEEKSKNNKRTGNGDDGADDRTELRAKVDRNAEEKIRGCKEGQRKHGNFLKGSIRERENLQVNADDSRATLNFRDANMTAANENQTVTEDTNMAMTTNPTKIIFGPPKNETHYYPHHTEYPPYLGYYGGYPQNVNRVDLTTGSNTHHDHNQINYNLPYEQRPNFYQNDKYNVYSSSHFNPPFSGPFPSDQINEYAGTDVNRFYHSPEYQPPYNDGFRPVT
ncbi:uncharacterized protein LOC115234668 [Formica exsecta]|uniref:uncharacterized protein LOC115234668 n=1 Tax=Formica exsecta TaxID=72781 RepID=UPI00114336B1|nr:uncharacterized protein LOC115234668 [Formica exsecta]